MQWSSIMETGLFVVMNKWIYDPALQLSSVLLSTQRLFYFTLWFFTLFPDTIKKGLKTQDLPSAAVKTVERSEAERLDIFNWRGGGDQKQSECLNEVNWICNYEAQLQMNPDACRIQ